MREFEEQFRDRDFDFDRFDRDEEMRLELKRKEMSILPGNHRIEVRSTRFRPFTWPESVEYKGSVYRFGYVIPMLKSRSYIFNGSAIYTQMD